MRRTTRSNPVPPATKQLSRSSGKGKDTLNNLRGRHSDRTKKKVPWYLVWFGLVLLGQLRGSDVLVSMYSIPSQPRTQKQPLSQIKKKPNSLRKITLFIYS